MSGWHWKMHLDKAGRDDSAWTKQAFWSGELEWVWTFYHPLAHFVEWFSWVQVRFLLKDIKLDPCLPEYTTNSPAPANRSLRKNQAF